MSQGHVCKLCDRDVETEGSVSQEDHLMCNEIEASLTYRRHCLKYLFKNIFPEPTKSSSGNGFFTNALNMIPEAQMA